MAPKNISFCFQQPPLPQENHDVFLQYMRQATTAPALANAALLVANGCLNTYAKAVNSLYIDNNIDPPSFDMLLSNKWVESMKRGDFDTTEVQHNNPTKEAQTECPSPLVKTNEVIEEEDYAVHTTSLTNVISNNFAASDGIPSKKTYETMIPTTKEVKISPCHFKFKDRPIPKPIDTIFKLSPLGPFSDSSDESSDSDDSWQSGTENNHPITSTPMVFDIPNVFTFDDLSASVAIPESISVIEVNPLEYERNPPIFPLSNENVKMVKPIEIPSKKSIQLCIGDTNGKCAKKPNKKNYSILVIQERNSNEETNVEIPASTISKDEDSNNIFSLEVTIKIQKDKSSGSFNIESSDSDVTSRTISHQTPSNISRSPRWFAIRGNNSTIAIDIPKANGGLEMAKNFKESSEFEKYSKQPEGCCWFISV